jgi:hypothetical protein
MSKGIALNALARWRHKRIPSRLIVCSLLLAAGLLCGCTTSKSTTTPRSATEQLLLSTATDHALKGTNLGLFAGRKVFLDGAYFESYDSKYAVGALRDALSRAGVLITDAVTNSDVIMEARSGALALDQTEFTVGIPAIPLPIPVAGAMKTPDLAFYQSQRRRAVAKFSLLAYNRHSSAHIYSSGPLDGTAEDNSFQVLFIGWNHTDVPENQLTGNMRENYQTWFPQLDLANLPVATESRK